MKMGHVRKFEGVLEDMSDCKDEVQQVLGKWWSGLQPAGLTFKARLVGTSIEPTKQGLVRKRLS